jgi:hypothetical protein
VDITKPPPNSVLFPTLEDLARFDKQLRLFGSGLVIDLETAGPHIICAGLGVATPQGMGLKVCLRFRTKGGGLYWSWPDHLKATEWLAKWLADDTIAKIFHYGVGFDVRVLEDLGFEVNGRIIDTMGMAHTAYSEAPKGLQWLATTWLGTPRWKDLVDEKDGE